MPVVARPRYLLRGKIRQQCRYSIAILQRLSKAYVTSGEVLPIATGLAVGDCPLTYYSAIILQLQTGLAAKS
jgi:hypothetical protein